MRIIRRALAIIRRVSLTGIICLIISSAALGVPISSIISMAQMHSTYEEVFCLFLVISPAVYLLFFILSVVVVRRFGISRETQKEKGWGYSIFECIKSDVLSPFHTIRNFFVNFFCKFPYFYPEDLKKKSRTITAARFVWMIIVAALCAIGLLLLSSGQ